MAVFFIVFVWGVGKQEVIAVDNHGDAISLTSFDHQDHYKQALLAEIWWSHFAETEKLTNITGQDIISHLSLDDDARRALIQQKLNDMLDIHHGEKIILADILMHVHARGNERATDQAAIFQWGDETIYPLSLHAVKEKMSVWLHLYHQHKALLSLDEKGFLALLKDMMRRGICWSYENEEIKNFFNNQPSFKDVIKYWSYIKKDREAYNMNNCSLFFQQTAKWRRENIKFSQKIIKKWDDSHLKLQKEFLAEMESWYDRENETWRGDLSPSATMVGQIWYTLSFVTEKSLHARYMQSVMRLLQHTEWGLHGTAIWTIFYGLQNIDCIPNTFWESINAKMEYMTDKMKSTDIWIMVYGLRKIKSIPDVVRNKIMLKIEDMPDKLNGQTVKNIFYGLQSMNTVPILFREIIAAKMEDIEEELHVGVIWVILCGLMMKQIPQQYQTIVENILFESLNDLPWSINTLELEYLYKVVSMYLYFQQSDKEFPSWLAEAYQQREKIECITSRYEKMRREKFANNNWVQTHIKDIQYNT